MKQFMTWSCILPWTVGTGTCIRGLFDKFMENVYKIVSVPTILIVFAYDTGQYVYDRYCKFQLNMFTRKKVTHVLLIYGFTSGV